MSDLKKALPALVLITSLIGLWLLTWIVDKPIPEPVQEELSHRGVNQPVAQQTMHKQVTVPAPAVDTAVPEYPELTVEQEEELREELEGIPAQREDFKDRLAKVEEILKDWEEVDEEPRYEADDWRDDPDLMAVYQSYLESNPQAAEEFADMMDDIGDWSEDLRDQMDQATRVPGMQYGYDVRDRLIQAQSQLDSREREIKARLGITD